VEKEKGCSREDAKKVGFTRRRGGAERRGRKKRMLPSLSGRIIGSVMPPA
jgi:hypothetical protein